MNDSLSKERLEKIASWRETYGADSNVMIPAAEAEELARRELQRREAAEKPVEYRWCYPANEESGATQWQHGPIERYDSFIRLIASKDPEIVVEKLFTAPPLPVVPDELTFYDFNAEYLCGDIYKHEYCAGWNAYRTALLQLSGNQERVNYPAIPEGWAVVPTAPTEAMMLLLGMHGSFDSMIAQYQKALAAAPQPKKDNS